MNPETLALIAALVIPDPTITPGAVRTHSVHTICTQRTKEVRRTTLTMRRRAYARYGVAPNSGACTGGCEVDHLIPLEAGGADVQANLWPMPYQGTWNARQKDRLENLGHAMICSGRRTPAEVQAWFTGDWRAAYIREVVR